MDQPFRLWTDLVERLDVYREEEVPIGMTTGCFDLLHCGHVQLIDELTRHCGVLIVGVNSDESIQRLKGAERPINTQNDRVRMLAAIKGVDHVVLFEEDTPCELIRVVRPNVYMKGGDYDPAELVEESTVLAHGGMVLRGPLVPGRSTTALARRLAALPGILEG